MKVIFLDFDGVLNSDELFNANPARGHRIGLWYEQLDPFAVARLNTIVALTGAEVVVSSSWRYVYNIEGLQSTLNDAGFVGTVVDVTPKRPDSHRGAEINDWLDAQSKRPEAFVLLDDDTKTEPLCDHHVLTLMADGLQDRHVERAVRILGYEY